VTVGELRRLLETLPDSTPVAVEYDAGHGYETEIDARLEGDTLVIDTDPTMRALLRR
jgi:hypothetical protein